MIKYNIFSSQHMQTHFQRQHQSHLTSETFSSIFILSAFNTDLSAEQKELNFDADLFKLSATAHPQDKPGFCALAPGALWEFGTAIQFTRQKFWTEILIESSIFKSLDLGQYISRRYSRFFTWKVIWKQTFSIMDLATVQSCSVSYCWWKHLWRNVLSE